MTRFIDLHRQRFGVAPICRVLGWCESTYYAYQARPPSDRALRDEFLKGQIRRVHEANYGVYGARKVWRALGREGIQVARCTVERLMRELGLAGVRRGKPTRTTTAGEAATALPDLLDRDFSSARPNRKWVADLTYVRTGQGFCYVAFVIDCFSRMIVGWALATHLRTELPLQALVEAMWRRDGAVDGLIHHSDRGVQYTSIAYTQRLEEAGVAPSVGSRGDSYDNALAEATIGLYKAELVEHRGPWRTRQHLELATLDYIGWFNERRLHGELGYVPPVEFEAAYHASLGQQALPGMQ